MLDKTFYICYNAYAVNYGLKHEVTLITGNQREFMWTSPRHRPAGDQLEITFFNLLQQDTRGQVYHRLWLKVGSAITGGIKNNGNTSYQNQIEGLRTCSYR